MPHSHCQQLIQSHLKVPSRDKSGAEACVLKSLLKMFCDTTAVYILITSVYVYIVRFAYRLYSAGTTGESTATVALQGQGGMTLDIDPVLAKDSGSLANELTKKPGETLAVQTADTTTDVSK